MKNIFNPGDVKTFKKIVSKDETAKFASGEVHPVYATFALARDAEWVCRLFVLEMKEDDEEGIGSKLSVEHMSPALIGELVYFKATVKSIGENSILCAYEAHSGERLIARGEQEQKILKKSKINHIFNSITGGRKA